MQYTFISEFFFIIQQSDQDLLEQRDLNVNCFQVFQKPSSDKRQTLSSLFTVYYKIPETKITHDVNVDSFVLRYGGLN